MDEKNKTAWVNDKIIFSKKYFNSLLFWVIVWLVLLILLTEYLYRYFNEDNVVLRYSQPYIEFGGEYDPDDLDSISDGQFPIDYDYHYTGFSYIYNFSKQLSSISEHWDFLFYNATHAKAAKQKNNGELIRIFVIGDSAAQGLGASKEEKTWWRVLEKKINESQMYNVEIIMMALPSSISTQHRIFLDMMVLPLCPDLVITYNGFLDYYVPVAYGVRPGDVYIQSSYYEQSYNPFYGIKLWLVQESTIYRHYYLKRRNQSIDEQINILFQDTKRIENYIYSSTSIYLENIYYMNNSCMKNNIECLFFLQPTRVMYKKTPDSIHSEKLEETLVLMGIEKLQQEIEFNQENPIYDLSGIFNEITTEENIYHDLIHVGDVGQKIIAETLFPIVIDHLEKSMEKANCKCNH